MSLVQTLNPNTPPLTLFDLNSLERIISENPEMVLLAVLQQINSKTAHPHSIIKGLILIKHFLTINKEFRFFVINHFEPKLIRGGAIDRIPSETARTLIQTQIEKIHSALENFHFHNDNLKERIFGFGSGPVVARESRAAMTDSVGARLASSLVASCKEVVSDFQSKGFMGTLKASCLDVCDLMADSLELMSDGIRTVTGSNPGKEFDFSVYEKGRDKDVSLLDL